MQENSRGRGNDQPRFPLWAEALITPAVLVMVTALYMLSLHLSLDAIGYTGTGEVRETRDAWYFGAHAAWTVAAIGAGTSLGILFRRSAFGFGALFLVWIAVAMAAAQVATFQLACEGHNDIIRHWQC